MGKSATNKSNDETFISFLVVDKFFEDWRIGWQVSIYTTSIL
jgi:hypothetical protein